MGQFVGRASELSELEKLYGTNEFQMTVIYGRRRVGKTTLINHFIRDKKAAYCMAVESNIQENQHMMSMAVWRLMGQGEDMPDFGSFSSILQKLAEISKEERIIFAIDEYPYLAAADPAVSSVLQSFIDKELKDSKLFLILCGSSMSFMEHQVLGYKSPLYGRRTAQIKVEPFGISEVRSYFKKYSEEEIFYIFACTGGIPEYMRAFDEEQSVDDNIKNLFFNSFGRLYEEPANLIKQEMRTPAAYNAIIGAIASGYNKLSEIASKAAQPSSGCSALLTGLIELGIVEKVTPCGENATRKTIYKISDQMFRFWYRFVGPNLSLINAGYGETVYEQKVRPFLNDFCGPVFEEVCKNWMLQLNGQLRLPELFSQVGNWWGGNPKTRRQEEIDILLRGEENIILCECKWRNELMDTDVLEAIERRGELFNYQKKQYYLFSKSGFSKQLKEAAENREDCVLVSYLEECVIGDGYC